MVDVDEAALVVRRPHRRRQLIGAVVAVLVLAAATVLLILRHEDGKYGPIANGPFGGPGPSAGVVRNGPDSVTMFRLVTKGSRTTYVYASLVNKGEHSVVITGIDTDEIMVSAKWAPSPESDLVAFPNPESAWRDFPVTASDEIVQIRYEIRRPRDCQDKPMDPEMAELYTESHTVHWESLWGDHTTRVSGLPNDRAIQVC